MLVFFTGVDHGGPARCEHQAQGVSCRCEIQDGSTHIFMFDCHVTTCCIRCPPKLSVLGPLLFNSYFNNLGPNIPNFVWSETKLTLCISRRKSLRSFPGLTTGICSTCVSACISCTLCTTSLWRWSQAAKLSLPIAPYMPGLYESSVDFILTLCRQSIFGYIFVVISYSKLAIVVCVELSPYVLPDYSLESLADRLLNNLVTGLEATYFGTCICFLR